MIKKTKALSFFFRFFFFLFFVPGENRVNFVSPPRREGSEKKPLKVQTKNTKNERVTRTIAPMPLTTTVSESVVS